MADEDGPSPKTTQGAVSGTRPKVKYMAHVSLHTYCVLMYVINNYVLAHT